MEEGYSNRPPSKHQVLTFPFSFNSVSLSIKTVEVKKKKRQEMAPGALIPESTSASAAAELRIKNHNAPKDIFPDGIRTSGQHPPVYDELKPYSAFPKEISGQTVWKKEDYENNPEKWVHPFTDEEVQELSDTADQFIESGTPLTGISKVVNLYIPKYFLVLLSRSPPVPSLKEEELFTIHSWVLPYMHCIQINKNQP